MQYGANANSGFHARLLAGLLIACATTPSAPIHAADQTEPAGLIPVWNQQVDPANDPRFSSRQVRPVTRNDFENRFQTTALRHLTGDYRKNLDIYTRVYDFGDVVWPNLKFVGADNFQEIVDEVARRDLYIFDIWGYVPMGDPNSLEWGEFSPATDKHQYLLDTLGPKFLGWSNGEQDGRFVGNYALTICPAPLTRREAYQHFVAYFRRHSNDLHNYLTLLAGEPLLHYIADMDEHRLIGAETAQALPSVPMWYCFIRGAGKQYGLMWFGNASVWNRWATKDYGSPEGRNTYKGTSLSLLKRLWYVETMYDSSLMGFEAYQLNHNKTTTVELDGQEMQVPALTALGEINLEAIDWCKSHPDRGVMYTPVALVWDFYTGWLPARSLYTRYPYLVWGNMPYEKGDHQIDMLFRSFFPSYEDCSYYHNERGFLTATPCGDIFDVLLSNVPRFVLNRYNAALVIGPTKLEGELLETIKDFIDHGGSVATTAAQLTAESAPLFGVELTGQTHPAEYAKFPDRVEGFNEPPFTRHGLRLHEGTEILATTGIGEPLVVKRQTQAGGELLLFAADYGLSDWVLPHQSPVGVGRNVFQSGVNQPLPSPHLLLHHVRALLLPWLQQWNLVDVAGPPIQFITNVTSDPDRILLTLCNNEPEPWRRAVRFRNARIASGKNWMTGTAIEPGAAAWLELPPEELTVLELQADRPVVAFKQPDSRSLLPREYKHVSTEVRRRLDRLAPETALAAEMPEPLQPVQPAEPTGALYVNSWLFEGKEPASWIPALKQMGLAGVEIRATDLFDPNMANLWRELHSAGLRVGAVNAGVDLTPYSAGGLGTKVARRRETTLAWLERIMDLMSPAGIERLIVYPDKVDENYQSLEEHRQMMGQSLARLAVKAQERGITICLENMPRAVSWGPPLSGHSHELLSFIAAADSSAIKPALDTAHATIAGQEILQAFERLRPQGLQYVHLSDCRRLPNGLILDRHLPLATGDVDAAVLRKVFTQCKQAGLATCLHITAQSDPLGALRQTLQALRE